MDQTRALAEDIASQLGQLNYLTGGLEAQPALLVRLVDAQTREHLVTAIVGKETAEAVRDGLDAQVNDSRAPLYVVGGGR